MFERKHQRIQPAGAFVLPANPETPGFFRTVGGEAWLYYVMPDTPPMFDAPDATTRDRAATALMRIMIGLARLVPSVGLVYRKFARGLYRDIHVLAVATPMQFLPSRTLDRASAVRLLMDHQGRTVTDKITFIGVRLHTGGRVPGRSWLLGQLEDAGYVSAHGFEADSAYEKDRRCISRILTEAGCAPPTPQQWERAKAWWQTSRDPDAQPVLVEAGHMHTFPSWRAATVAQQYRSTGVSCRTWMSQDALQHSFPMSFVALGPLPFEGRDEHTDPDATWAARLLANRLAGGDGALCVSLRGSVEPGRLTAKQMRRDEEKLLSAVNRRIRDEAMGGRDKEKDESHLDQMAGLYETDGSAPPTLVDASCLAAIPQILDEENDGQVTSLSYPGIVKFNPLRQEAAFQAMQPGSEIDYNPSPVVWPAPIVAYAGFTGLSSAGEDSGLGVKADMRGALLGFTEADRQPVYMSAMAASSSSREPIVAILGASGSGKTWLADYVCGQWSEMENPLRNDGSTIPGFIFDPKQKSDFSRFVKAMGGRVIRLDDPALSNGALDPVKCMSGSKDFRDERTNTVVSMLASILDPANQNAGLQTDLMAIVDYGLAHGADCSGEAVAIAQHDHAEGADRDAKGRPLVPDSVSDVLRKLTQVAQSSSMFRIVYGTRHGLPKLNTASGLTLLMAGELNLIPSTNDVPSMIKRWVVRMCAMGGAAAMMGRGGYVFVDEAWILLGDEYGAKLVQTFGRLGRLQKYLPILASQRVQEFVDAKLQSFISRGILLSMSGRGEGWDGRSEAQAALRLFNLPDKGIIHDRVTANNIISSKTRQPNWLSLKALKDADGKPLRGSVCYYIGLDDTAVPVEVTIPQRLFDLLPQGDDEDTK